MNDDRQGLGEGAPAGEVNSFRSAWVIGGAAGIAAVAAVVFFIRAPGTGTGAAGLQAAAGGPSGGRETAGPRVGEPGGAEVSLVRLGGKGADPILSEEAILRDPRPLFLPTDWSSSRVGFPPAEPRGISDVFPARTLFVGSGEPVSLPAPIAVPRTPADLNAGDPPSAPLFGFGRAVAALPGPEGAGVAAGGASLGIVDSRTGLPALPAVVEGELRAQAARARPPRGGIQWNPIEFLVAVSDTGLVGAPVLNTTSGVEEVDSYFIKYLIDTMRIGDRLPPGYYRITFGP